MSAFNDGLIRGQQVYNGWQDAAEIARQREIQRQLDADMERIRKAEAAAAPVEPQSLRAAAPRVEQAGTAGEQAPMQAPQVNPIAMPGQSLKAAPLAPPEGQQVLPAMPPREGLEGTGPINPKALSKYNHWADSREIDPGTPPPAMGPAAAPAAPAAAAKPGPASSMSLRDTQSLERLNAKYQAMHDEALKVGRPDQALAAMSQGMKIRDQIRTMNADSYRQRYLMTNDPNVYADYFNKYVGNGVNVDGITKAADGSFVMKYTDASGSSGEKVFKPAEMEQWIRFVEDPRAARAMEVEHAKRLHESALRREEAAFKMQGDAAVAQVKERFQKVENKLIDTLTGKEYDAGKHYVLKGPDGTGERLVMVRDGKMVDVAGGGTGPGLDTALPKPLQDRIDKTNASILSGLKSPISSMSAEDQRAIWQQQAVAADLWKSNYGTPNYGHLTDGLAAEIAQQVQTGKLTPREAELGGRQVRMVEYQGRKYVLGLNPFDTQRDATGGRSAAPAPSAPAMPGPQSLPRATPKQTGLGTQTVTGTITQRPTVIFQPGQVVNGKDGKRYRFKGGNDEDRANWELIS